MPSECLSLRVGGVCSECCAKGSGGTAEVALLEFSQTQIQLQAGQFGIQLQSFVIGERMLRLYFCCLARSKPRLAKAAASFGLRVVTAFQASAASAHFLLLFQGESVGRSV